MLFFFTFIGNIVCNSPQDIVNDFVHYTGTIYSRNTRQNIRCLQNLSQSQVNVVMKKLKNKMTADPDGVPNFLVRDCRIILSRPSLIIFDLALSTAIFTDLRNCTKVCPVLKSGSSNNMQNHRPISIYVSCNIGSLTWV